LICLLQTKTTLKKSVTDQFSSKSSTSWNDTTRAFRSAADLYSPCSKLAFICVSVQERLKTLKQHMDECSETPSRNILKALYRPPTIKKFSQKNWYIK